MCIESSFFSLEIMLPDFFICKKEQLRENCTVHPHEVILEVLKDHVQRFLDAKLCYYFLFHIANSKWVCVLTTRGMFRTTGGQTKTNIQSLSAFVCSHCCKNVTTSTFVSFGHGGDYHFEATSLWSNRLKPHIQSETRI